MSNEIEHLEAGRDVVRPQPTSAVARRSVLALMVGGAAALAGTDRATADDYARGVTRFRSVEIDTRTMAERGLSNYAERIRIAAKPVVANVFADRLDPKAPGGLKLVLRIDSIKLNEPGGSSNFGLSPHQFRSSATDWIEGAGLVVDGKGRVLATEPVTTSQSADNTSHGDVLAAEQLRTMRLIDTLARWVKQKV